MDRGGDQLFARATFARDQYGRTTRGHLRDDFQQPLHRRMLSQNLAQLETRCHAFAQFARFSGELRLFARARD
ncbi:MAG: hypothetical protein RL701_4748 [Pseudomonadota bacterium]